MTDFSNWSRPHLFKFELFIEGSEEAYLAEDYTVRSFIEAWCFVELIAKDSPDQNGFIHVSNDKGDLLIIAGVSVALSAIEECKFKNCERRVFAP